MNKTPIIIVAIIVILFLCCCSICSVLWTLGTWQMTNEPFRYERSRTEEGFLREAVEDSWKEQMLLAS